MTDSDPDTDQSRSDSDPHADEPIARSGPHADEPILVSGAPAGAARVAVIALHGRGGTARGVRNLFDPVYRHGVAFFAPQAFRNRWFPRPAGSPIAANEPDLTGAVAVVDRALKMAAAAGVPPERTVLTGFSQGGCVAAEFAVRHPRRYGGLVVLSGALPDEGAADRALAGDSEGTVLAGDLGGTPVRLSGHADDPRVDSDRVRESARVFEALGGEVTVDLAPGEAHAVTAADFEALGTLVETLLKVASSG